MRLISLFVLTVLFACEAKSAIHCGDYYAEKTPQGTLYNNVWNKNAAGKFAWSQCLERDAATGWYGWSWNWPVRSGDIFGYPQIKLGTSPWAPSPSTDFPLDNSSLHSLVVEHELQIQGETEHNIATSLWLTNTPDIGTQPNPSAIVAELMIWTYTTKHHMNPAGSYRGDFSDGTQTWEVWFDKNWSDASGANKNKWIYITFRAKNSNMKASFDVAKLTRYAVKQKILPAKFYIADIELGTEIMSGSGVAWVKQFKAAIGTYTFIEGKLPQDAQPDGNSIVIEGPAEMLVIDTGRHPEHTDKILAVARARNKPITAIINTHWHLDHATGNARIRAVYPDAGLYASTAVEGALQGFLIRSVDQAQATLQDPAVPEARKVDARLYLGAINDPANLRPDHPVTGPTIIKLGERELQLHLARHAATEGDVWIEDRASKTVFAGDLVVVPLPFFDTGCADGWRKALAEIDQLDFETLVPGHGLPMDHATFSRYRQAFDAYTACADSEQPTASCVATWVQQGQPFAAAHPDPKYVQAALTYYVDQVLRVQAKRAEFCGK